MTKILLVLQGAWVAPRFDLATEVVIVQEENGEMIGKPREMLLPGPSGEELCGLIVKEGVSRVVCGGIEEGHYQYLRWKGIDVLDRVIGTGAEALARAVRGTLAAGGILRPEEGKGS